jgi:hypothetical protein
VTSWPTLTRRRLGSKGLSRPLTFAQFPTSRRSGPYVVAQSINLGAGCRIRNGHAKRSHSMRVSSICCKSIYDVQVSTGADRSNGVTSNVTLTDEPPGHTAERDPPPNTHPIEYAASASHDAGVWTS